MMERYDECQAVYPFYNDAIRSTTFKHDEGVGRAPVSCYFNIQSK